MGAGQLLASKLISEYQSGINQVDIFMPGATSILLAKAHGIIGRLEPVLILPEVRDPKNWLDGRMPYYDKEGMILGYLAMTNPTIIYNSDLVKEGEITSHLDLLKPQWKGQTVMYDPTVSGAGLSGAYFLTMEWGNERVYEYITAMIKKQDTLVTRDMGQQAEWVTRGKYKVALWSQFPATSQYLKAGAHLAAALTIKERKLIGPMNGALSI